MPNARWELSANPDHQPHLTKPGLTGLFFHFFFSVIKSAAPSDCINLWINLIEKKSYPKKILKFKLIPVRGTHRTRSRQQPVIEVKLMIFMMKFYLSTKVERLYLLRLL
jgi:hypothetical protein